MVNQFHGGSFQSVLSAGNHTQFGFTPGVKFLKILFFFLEVDGNRILGRLGLDFLDNLSRPF
jgi:hypothetical protein